MSIGKGRNVRKGTKGFVETAPKKPAVPTIGNQHQESLPVLAQKLYTYHKECQILLDSAQILYLEDMKKVIKVVDEILEESSGNGVIFKKDIGTLREKWGLGEPGKLDKYLRAKGVLSIGEAKAQANKEKITIPAIEERTRKIKLELKLHPKKWWQSYSSYLADICETCGAKVVDYCPACNPNA